jgi:hypothetical protein
MVEWQNKCELEQYRNQAMGLWFEGGSCTGGNVSYFVNESGLKIDSITGNIFNTDKNKGEVT